MTAPPGPASSATDRRRSQRQLTDAVLGSGMPQQRPAPQPSQFTVSGRFRLLSLSLLLALIGLFGLARWLASAPSIDAVWAADDQGRLVLAASPWPSLDELRGRSLLATMPASAAGQAASESMSLDASLLHRSARWQADAGQREHQLAQQRHVRELLRRGELRLVFDGETVLDLPVAPRGYEGLGFLFWPLAALALLLPTLALTVLLSRPRLRNLLYLLLCLGASGNLLFTAVHSVPGLTLSAWPMANDLAWRLVFDGLTVAAGIHALALHPRRLRGARWIAVAAWGGVALWTGLLVVAPPAALWWGMQSLLAAGLVVAVSLAKVSHRLEPNPVAQVMRRLCEASLLMLILVSLAAAGTASHPELAAQGAALAAGLWALLVAALLLLLPFLSRSRQLLADLALLAGVSAAAMALNLLFVTLFSLGTPVALALALFVSLGLYAAARQWLVRRQPSQQRLSTERAFEQLYRVARAVQAEPARHAELLGRMLRDLFEPTQLLRANSSLRQARVVGSGAMLMVPLKGDVAAPDTRGQGAALVLRFAQRGQRLFEVADARLADRLVEQLSRAVAYDKAVERGRSEERQRIAQDLHDDIGARLLTLMYQAQTTEMEEYIRHTLQDLKTLTRGLAASEHRLSHAAAEWKADLAQRLSLAQVELQWSLRFDQDLRLSVVQWSALTRVLRELVSNALYHASARRVDVAFSLEGGCLKLSVADDGCGRAPHLWASGLGLGGVRKRVKLLGGEVHWRENQPEGIVCELLVANFGRPV